ncbi:hypothetical protein J416_06390 [Gracilibacillus halophilus YIM-C55.5]|uniref:peptidylprolyl isomerase n=1 Tax=Gracilibacillus halophilus YIM-C55.5 TaxID=1308866 RepID=N4WAA9_9BACI|nr:SurA N-terminal domain-containing protein [Gracilibacillus halophilus]ENH97243.1 hypothetical protein J416_06390 [Gracilibacillus halophilus YIM-C55.5]
MKKLLITLLSVSIAIILTACNGEDTENSSDETGNSDSSESANVEVTEEEKIDAEKVVASVNGEEISGETYNTYYRQVKLLLDQNGQDVSDTEQVKQQTLNEIVGQELIIQDAAEKGIAVSDEKVNEQFEATKQQEQFSENLEARGYTEETYKDQLSYSLLLDKYLEEEFDVEVTEEEIQQTYNQAVEQQQETEQELPELAEVKDDIKQQIKKQKQQQQIPSKIETLKEKADIEYNI